MTRDIVNTDGLNQNNELIKKIEHAYKIYRLSEMYLADVSDDYGKLKIARLRLEFARHELQTLLKEAGTKGINLKDSEIIRAFLHDNA